MTLEEKLKRFTDDEHCLDALLEYDSRLNFFKVLNLSKLEVYHSDFLAFILDPHNRHGLGTQMLEKLSCSETDAARIDWNSFTVKREWMKIDILAVSDSEKYLLCIENKIDTTEHSNQLNQYRNMVNRYYSDYRKRYIYLSPKGKNASDPINWQAMSYADILRIIDNLDLESGNPEAVVFIRHYANMLRRDIVGDEELKELCQQLYVKHKTALDLIIANKPNPADVYETLKRWAEEKSAKGEISLDLTQSTKTCLRFTTQAMSGILPDSDEPDSVWYTKNHYFYEIWIMEQPHDYFIQIALNPTNMSSPQRKICEKIMDLRKDVQVMGKSKVYLNPFVAVHQDYYLQPSDEIWMCADRMFEELRIFEREMEESLQR